MEVLRWSFPTYIVPFYNAIFSLLILILLNMAFKKFLKKTFLNQGELITIYVMISAASALASINMMQVLISIMRFGLLHQRMIGKNYSGITSPNGLLFLIKMF
jgi:hypothetical protein